MAMAFSPSSTRFRPNEMKKEISRMRNLGIGVLQQLSLDRDGKHVTYTYFDTEPQGKFVLGLVYWPGGAPPAGAPGKVSHLAPVVRESEPVSAFWQKLGFPAFRMEHATPREDSAYRGKPLWFAFDVGYQSYTQFGYEWIAAQATPQHLCRLPQDARGRHSAFGYAGRRLK